MENSVLPPVHVLNLLPVRVAVRLGTGKFSYVASSTTFASPRRLTDKLVWLLIQAARRWCRMNAIGQHGFNVEQVGYQAGPCEANARIQG